MNFKEIEVPKSKSDLEIYKLSELLQKLLIGLQYLDELLTEHGDSQIQDLLNEQRYKFALQYEKVSNLLQSYGYIWDPLTQQTVPLNNLDKKEKLKYILQNKKYVLHQFLQAGLYPDENEQPISKDTSPVAFDTAIANSDYNKLVEESKLSQEDTLPNPLTGEPIPVKSLTPQLQYELLLLNRDHMRAMALSRADVTSNLDSDTIGDSGTLRRIPYGWKPLAELAVERDILYNPHNYLTFTDEELKNINEESKSNIPRILSTDAVMQDMPNLDMLQRNTLGVQYLDALGRPNLSPINDYIISNTNNRYDYSNIGNNEVSKNILDHLRVLNTMLTDPSPDGTPALYPGLDALIRQHLLQLFPEHTFASKDNSIYRVGIQDFANRLRQAGQRTPDNIVDNFLSEYAEETGKDYLSLLNNKGVRVLLNNESLKEKLIREYQLKAQQQVEHYNTLISDFEKQHANTPGFTPEDKSPIGWGDKLWRRKGVSRSDALMYALANLTGFDQNSLNQSVGYNARMQVYRDLFQKYTTKYYDQEYTTILDRIDKLDPSQVSILQNELGLINASKEELAHILALNNARQIAANTLFESNVSKLLEYVNRESNLAAENAINMYMNYDHSDTPLDLTKPIQELLTASKSDAIDPLRRGHISDVSPLDIMSLSFITGNEDHNLKLMLINTSGILDPVLKYVPNKLIDTVRNSTLPENPTLLEYLNHQLNYNTYKQGVNAVLPSEIMKAITNINPAISIGEGIGTIRGANIYSDNNPGSAGSSLNFNPTDNPAHLLEDIYNRGMYGTSAPRTKGSVQTALGLLDALLLGSGSVASKAALKSLPVKLRWATRLGVLLLPGQKSFISQFGNNTVNSMLGDTVFRPAIKAIEAGAKANTAARNANANILERLARTAVAGGTAPVKDFAGLLKTDLKGGILDKIFTVMNPVQSYNPYFSSNTFLSLGLPRIFAESANQVGEILASPSLGILPTGKNLNN